MPVPFGFSVGDLLAVGDLARRIAKALSESRGATAEYKSLGELLLSLNSSLHAASAIFFSSDAGSLSTTALLNGVRHELECCKRLMDEFLRNSRQYTETLLNGRPGRRFRDEWRKITWSLYRDEDVKKLQGKLQGHIAAFQMYTFAITWQGLACTGQKVIESSETSKRIELTVLEMFAFLKDLHDKLPKAIGYTWEGACTNNQKPIFLEDALGRTVFVPLILCKNKNSFHDVLEIMFRDLPGHKSIVQKEYEVVDDAKGALIQDLQWESMVLPGVRIAISILIKAMSHVSKVEAQRCPRCDASNARATPEKGSLKCGICNLIFRTVDIERITELPEPPPKLDTLDIRQRPAPLGPEVMVDPIAYQTVQRRPQREEMKAWEKEVKDREAREQYLFRRVHVYREVLKHLDKTLPPRDLWFMIGPRYGVRYSTPLQAAAGQGNVALVRQLISGSAAVNAAPADFMGRTALQAAANGGHLEVVELLLSRSADVNASPSEEWGLTALQAAADSGYLEVVELLLSRGADVNANASKHGGKTALQAAAYDGHLEVVQLLLSRGAEVNADLSTTFGMTALQAAAGGGHLEAVELLLSRGAEVNADPSATFGRTALQAAADGGHLEIVELLLSRGADVNANASKHGGKTALQAAAYDGHLEVVQLLLFRGAEVNADPSAAGGRTALQAAASGGHLEVVELLLSRSADVNVSPSEERGLTALQAAADGGHLEVVKLLLSHGAEVNADPSATFGRTALQAAADGGHLEAVELLLSHSADVNGSPSEERGLTALQAAVDGGHLEVVELLLSRGAEANIHRSNPNRNPALYIAARGGHLKIIHLLLLHCANLNVRIPKDEWSAALWVATAHGHLEVAQLLREHGAYSYASSDTKS